MADPVLLRVDERVLVITLNRPEARNAFDQPVAAGLVAAMRRLDADPELSVVSSSAPATASPRAWT